MIRSFITALSAIALAVPTLSAGVAGPPPITLDLPVLPAGKTLTLDYDTIVQPLGGNTSDISTQATITADGGINMVTDDPETVAVPDDPTLTAVFENAAPTTGTVTAAAVGAPEDGLTAYSFTVQYQDDGTVTNVDASTIDATDITVTGPGGPVSVTMGTTADPDGASVTATYTITPPGGSWDASDNGTYTIGVAGMQVADTGSGPALFAAANSMLATFDVNVPDPSYTIVALDADKAEGNSGTTAFTFTVNRGGDTSAAGSVDYTVSGADAADFSSSLTGTIPFAIGSSSETLTVQVAGDSDVETDDAFTVTLGNPMPSPGWTIGTPGSAGGTIRNDDASFAIAATDADKLEGNSGSSGFTFTVTRSGFLGDAANVDFAVTGSGGDPADATDFAGGVLPSGTANFAASEATRLVSVDVTGDTDLEPDESFTVTLSSSSGPVITSASESGTIQNDDALTVDIVADDADANENTAAGGNFRISRNSSSGALSVNIQLDPASTATPAADFSLGGVMLAGGAATVIIPDGQTFLDIPLTPNPDEAAEASETATLQVVATPGYAVGTSEDTVTIAANDTVVTNAGDFDPNTDANGGEGTLRQAIINANAIPGPQTIMFSDVDGTQFTTTPQTITLTAGELLVTSGSNIDAPAAPGRVTIDANGLGRAINVQNTSDPTAITRLTITGGLNAAGLGGGMQTSGFPFTTLRECVIEGNSASAGGGFYSQGRTRVIDCTIQNNTGTATSGLYGGGGICVSAELALVGSTVTNNETSHKGGGIHSEGAFVTALNSTISGNRAAGGGGGIRTSNPMRLDNVTITGNIANFGQGGGSSAVGGGFRIDASSATINNSIIAGNVTDGSGPSDIHGGISGLYNLIGVDTGIDTVIYGGTPDPSNQIGTSGSPIDPLLGPLADNGGATPTHMVLAGSPAIDMGDPAFDPASFMPPMDFDQRGPGFNRVMNGRVDIGAVELQADITPPVITCPADLTVECHDSVDPSNTGTATATDDRDPNPMITFSDVVTPGVGGESSIARTWTAIDMAGNPSSCVQTITVVDTTAPMITCPPDLTIECDDPVDPGGTGTATATDNCDPNPVITFSNVITPGIGGNFTLSRTWTATDANGNSSNCVQTITAVDTTAPMIICPADVWVECPFPTDPSNTGMAIATDNCDPNPVITFVDATTPGVGANLTIARTWTATDANGNSSNCTQTITVQDTTAPMLTCPPDVTVEWDQPNDPSALGSANATDTCDPAPVITFSDVTTPGVLGNYSIARTWTATDANGNSSNCIQTITVENTPPQVAADNPLVSVDEGSEATNTGTFSDTSGDTITITADIGMVTQSGTDSGTWSWSYTPDDGPLMPTVTITATDSLLAQTTTTFDLDVANVNPTVVLDPVTSIDENGVATLTGTISDPSVADTFTLDIDWGDPLSPGNVESVSIGASATGSQTFSLTHQYLDDNPTGTPQDSYTISATVTDDDSGTGMDTESVTVSNVAPIVELDLIPDIDENGTIMLIGTVTDPGTLDTFTLDIDWGAPSLPGNNEQVMLAASATGSQTFMIPHQYVDDDPSGTARDDYTVQVTVTDDDTQSGSDSDTFKISNVAPVLTLDPVLSIDENGVATLTGTIDDPGTIDTFSLFVDWGDPINPDNFENVTFSESATGTQVFTLTHQYLDDNPSGTPLDSKTIFALVLDDEGASDTAQTVVDINNVAPEITSLNASPGAGGVTLDVAFTDPGMPDTHTAQVQWGDGSSTPVTVPAGARSFQLSHNYGAEPPPGGFPITVTVTDDDTGSDTDSVGPPAPPAGPGGIDQVVRLPNGDLQLGFSAQPGEQFQIYYSHDLVTWIPVMGIETATGNRVQWTDEGPPATMSAPSSVPKRFYRYVKLPGMMPPP